MARTLTEIQAAILAEKDNQPALATLDSPSTTAIWRLWVFVVASALWVQEQLWELFKVQLQDIANRTAAGTAPWYAQKVREFQWSGTALYYLVFDANNQAVYNQVSAADRIVRYVAVTERSDGTVVIKAAADGGGVPQPLTTPQITALVDYLLRIKFAGTVTEVISLPADTIRCPMEVYYRPGINPTLLLEQVKTAVRNYLNSLPFSGTLLIEHIQDAVQRLEPVTSVKLGTIQAGNPPTLELAAISRMYETLAGYIVHDETPSYTLDDLITLVPDPII
jgi:hypothetical protein